MIQTKAQMWANRIKIILVVLLLLFILSLLLPYARWH